jgi:uracil-DNA glycosylase
MKAKRTIGDFINTLQNIENRELCYNPYASGDQKRDKVRRNNLALYLQEMLQFKPRTMLVGEAPGYNGCHWTGIPFCSERQLVRGVGDHDLFGLEKGYSWTSEKENGYTEPSGTILWGIIAELKTVPLVWNAFPLHPHKKDKALSNRTPSLDELKSLSSVLDECIELFSIKNFIAVGKKAELVLTELGHEAKCVRHPANGGKNACRDGLLKYLG